jgi:hypothetical protein
MGARWYDPSLGRWLSPDTLVPNPASPQSLNRYTYVGNSPLRFVDPTGFFKEEQLKKWFGDDWRKLFDSIWQELLLMAEFGDVVLYGDNLSAMFVQTESGELTTWSMSPSDEFSGRGEVPLVGSVANSDAIGLYRSTMANREGGPSQGHLEHQYATDARFRAFERIMAWDKNATGSIMLGYDWYRSSLTNQNVSMRPKFCGVNMGLSEFYQVGGWALAARARPGIAREAMEKGVQTVAVSLAADLGGPAAALGAALDIYSWTALDTSFALHTDGLGLPPVVPVPAPY